MISIAICDDNKSFLRMLKQHIEAFFVKNDFECTVESFDSGNELISLGADISCFNVIFLDIDMKGVDGIEAARVIRYYSDDIIIVFVTAFIKYSLEGYKFNAIRYILKEEHTLNEALTECLETIIKRINYNVPTMRFIFREKEMDVRLDKLFFIESRLHTLEFHIVSNGNEKYTMYGKMGDIYSRLKEYGFVRIHQSYLVNLRYIAKLKQDHLTLVDNTVLSISRSHHKEVKEAYVAYKGDF